MDIRHGQVTIDNVSWTPIKSIIDCYHTVINNITGATLKLRTDFADPATEYPLQSLLEYTIDAPRNTVMLKAATLMYGQLSAGTAAIQLRCRM